MAEFKSWKSYEQFAHATTQQTRYLRSQETEDFLEAIKATSKSRVQTLPRDRFFWRAQLGNVERPVFVEDVYITDEDAPFSPERMKPLRNRAPEGRANPKGIPYLYLATNQQTAISEVRPWVGSQISVGQFKTLHDLRLVNCSAKGDCRDLWKERAFTFNINIDPEGDEVEPPASEVEPPAAERERHVWSDIDHAFSRPVTSSDDTASYVPTQLLAELFKTAGYDGVAYRSSLGSGHNIALFDLDAADLVNCVLFEATQVEIKFAQTGNPYFVKKYTDAMPDS